MLSAPGRVCALVLATLFTACSGSGPDTAPQTSSLPTETGVEVDPVPADDGGVAAGDAVTLPGDDAAPTPGDDAAPTPGEDAAPGDDVAPADDAVPTDATPVQDTGVADTTKPADSSADTAVVVDTATSIDTNVSPTCGKPPDEPPSPTPSSPPNDLYPMTKHWERPKVDPNVVALTFDDGPNPATTNSILDTLKAKGVRATFFVNSRATLDLRTNVPMQETLRRIVAEGHVLGNHSASHYDLTLASTDIDAQLRMVEEDVKAVAPCAPPLTLVRAPFGEPYLSGTAEAQARVYPIVARHGVHIGWTIETRDFTCSTAACVIGRVFQWVDIDRRGTILMHDTQPQTAEALPTIIDELRKRGIGFVTSEKLVRDKYGKTSAQLVAEYLAKTGG